jgi:hypothetical protein
LPMAVTKNASLYFSFTSMFNILLRY